jgi:hypothetical protein
MAISMTRMHPLYVQHLGPPTSQTIHLPADRFALEVIFAMSNVHPIVVDNYISSHSLSRKLAEANGD